MKILMEKTVMKIIGVEMIFVNFKKNDEILVGKQLRNITYMNLED